MTYFLFSIWAGCGRATPFLCHFDCYSTSRTFVGYMTFLHGMDTWPWFRPNIQIFRKWCNMTAMLKPDFILWLWMWLLSGSAYSGLNEMLKHLIQLSTTSHLASWYFIWGLMKIIYLVLRSRLHKFDLPYPAIDAFVRGIVFAVGFGLYGFYLYTSS